MLKSLLLEENFKNFVINVIRRSKSTREATIIIMEQALPCLLYMNMRITEKFVRMILQAEMNHNINNCNELISLIEKFINTTIYGKGADRLGH